MPDEHDTDNGTPQPEQGADAGSGHAASRPRGAGSDQPEASRETDEEAQHGDTVGEKASASQATSESASGPAPEGPESGTDTDGHGNRGDSELSPAPEGPESGTDTSAPSGRIARFCARLGLSTPLVKRLLLGTSAGMVLLLGLLALIWSREPARFDVRANARRVAQAQGMDPKAEVPQGYVMVSTVIRLGRSLLDKGGGYLANDIMPPSVFMDDMPAWEMGVLTQIRIALRTLLMSASSGPQGGAPDLDIVSAQKAFDTDPASWWFPAAEDAYREGIGYLENYLQRLTRSDASRARFEARPVALASWLNEVEESLNELSGKLASSVGSEARVRGVQEAQSSSPTPDPTAGSAKTPWIHIDDVFYEARGTGWALLHLLDAVSVDFEGPLANAHTTELLNGVRRDLEGTQKPISSPMVLNGDEYGVFANHSLVMSAYLSRAETGIIALRSRLP